MSSSSEEYKRRSEWLASLKVGDSVAIAFGWPTRYTIGVIRSITPSRRLRVTNGRHGLREFSHEGKERGAHQPARLEKPSDDVIDAIARESALSRLGAIRWRDCDTELLSKVVALLDEWGIK